MKKITVTKSKLICLLISLVTSFVLWTYVVTVVNTELTEPFYRIPVVFSGEDTLKERGLTITSGKDFMVMLQLTSSRSVIQQLNSENITVTVDVSKITAPGKFERGYTITYPNSIQSSSVTVNRKAPSMISFVVEELVTTEIPVKTVFEGSVKDGYILESISTGYDTISITGTADQIKRVSYALITVNDEELSSSKERNMMYTLMSAGDKPVDMTGIEVDTDRVSVEINVVKFKEVPLVVEFRQEDGVTDANVDWKVNPATITISGDESVLKDINKIVLNTMDLSDVSENMTETYPIVLPDGIRNESGHIEATATIALSGLSTANLSVSDFKFIHVPEGFEASAVTQALFVTVRGPSESIQNVKNSNVTMIVDLSNISGAAGSYTVDSTALTLDGVDDIGILGEYSVTVALEKKTANSDAKDNNSQSKTTETES